MRLAKGLGSLLLLLAAAPAIAAPPANDQCGGAESIPSAGPFPYLTALDGDITDATSVGDPPQPSCFSAVSRSTWYVFQPAQTGQYTFSSCADAPTGTTVDATVVDVIQSTNGSCGSYVSNFEACNRDGCTVENQQGVVSADLTAGQTYFIVVYKQQTTPPTAGNTAVQLRVTAAFVPSNDLCTSAPALTLNVPAEGTTVLASDDYRTPTTSACWAGIGSQANDARGNDVAYSFTAPDAGPYAFRVSGFSAGGSDLVAYVADACPTGPSPQTVNCVLAANRNLNEGVEDVSCVSVAPGQTVYVFVDTRASGGTGSPFRIVAERCPRETEPNDTPQTASPFACGIRGTMDGSGIDFLSLGSLVAGQRIFAVVDGAAFRNGNPDLRVTTDTDTLEYDDADNDTPHGDSSPNVAGTIAAAGPAYLRVDATGTFEPYQVFAAVQPSSASAVAESEPNDTIATADAALEDYFSGSLAGPSPSTDVDVYSVTASAGDVVLLSLDGDPLRDETPINGALALLDASGATLESVNDPNQSSDNATSPGNLGAQRPRSPGEAIAYRISTSGTYYARVSISPQATALTGSGDYLLSIAKNCTASAIADLSIADSDAPDPVVPGSTITYTITVTNGGPAAAASVQMQDSLSIDTAFLSMTPPSGWTCVLPGPGPGGTITCFTPGLGAGAVASFTVNVASDLCGTPGFPAKNLATVQSTTPDPDAADLTASASTDYLPSLDTDGDGNPDVCDADDDNDGAPDVDDCRPLDPAVYAIPGEVGGVIFSDKDTLQWARSDGRGRLDLRRAAGPPRGVAGRIVAGRNVHHPRGWRRGEDGR